MGINVYQTTFMVFYAIFWGATFNAQPRWKAFQLPLVGILRVVTRRVILSFITLNILPIIYFAVIFYITSCSTDKVNVVNIIFLGVIPAFGIFGFYRLWLGIIEISPSSFYHNIGSLEGDYKYIEPTIGNKNDNPKNPDSIYIGDKKSGMLNILWAFVYISIGILTPSIYIIYKSCY